MADRIIDDFILTDIADSLRAATGGTDLITPEEMAGKVDECYQSGYGTGREAGYAEGKTEGYAEGLAARTYEVWTITLADGTVVEKEMALL